MKDVGMILTIIAGLTFLTFLVNPILKVTKKMQLKLAALFVFIAFIGFAK
jgi:hypothetical protein